MSKIESVGSAVDQSGFLPPKNPLAHVGRREFLKSAAGASLASLAMRHIRGAEPSPKENSGRDPLLVTTHPAIARARDLGLEILKPSQADLEHGLELHRDSLVFDTYGFAPRAAVEGERLNVAIQEGASAAEIQDLREEMSMTGAVRDVREREEFVAAMQVAGVTSIFQNAGEEGQSPLTLLKRLARFTFLSDSLKDVLVRATSADDIVEAKGAGKHCLYLTGNGVPLTQQWENVTEELGQIRLFFQLGIRMMHLTYNRRNMLGDGCAETANGGLSDFGRATIREMNRCGVILDVAHSGWQTSLEAAKASTKPMVASHTVCDELHHHIRAKPDNVIRAICDTGGLIGVCCISPFLGGSGDLQSLLRHIDFAAKKYGVEHVAIGTDVSHTSQYSSAENQKVTSRPRSRSSFASLWPEGALGGNWPRAASLSWTNWPLFTVGLVQLGYSDDDIRKIIGENTLKICRNAVE